MPGSSAGVVKIAIETPKGRIEAELYPDAAPITVANFLFYVDAGVYDGGLFHRSVTMENQPRDQVKIEVIQAGPNPNRAHDIGAPIPLERTTLTGLRHVDGAMSMGRIAPDSADAQFFICIGNQPELDFGGKRNPDGQGFAAFGRVVAGMDAVRAIQLSPVEEQKITPPVQIQRIERLN